MEKVATKERSAVFRIRKEYFDAIVDGTKIVEYRVDSFFWIRRLAPTPRPTIAVFICGKRVHRRRIIKRKLIPTPEWFSEQGRKDVSSTMCWAIYLGEEVK